LRRALAPKRTRRDGLPRTEHRAFGNDGAAVEFAGALDQMPALFDEPFGDSAAWSNYLIAQFARREVTSR